MKCNYENCKRKIALIIGDCKYCRTQFCAEHRLPEDHLCTGLSTCKKEHFDKNKIKLISEATHGNMKI